MCLSLSDTNLSYERANYAEIFLLTKTIRKIYVFLLPHIYSTANSPTLWPRYSAQIKG